MAKINELLRSVKRPSSIFPSRKGNIRLNWNELSPGYSTEIIKSILDTITPEVISSYPEYDVIYPLMAKYCGVGIDQVVLEAGSECGIKNVFEVFVPRSSMVVKPSPEFVMVEVYAEIFGAQLRNVHYDKELSFPISDFVEAIDNSISLVYLANPNGMTGKYIDDDGIIRILDEAKESDAAVLIDECYIDFSGKRSCIELIETYDNLIISRSFSKSFGLAGLRLGVLATNTHFCELLHKTRPMREINAFAAEIGKYMLQNIDIPMSMINDVTTTRDWVINELRSHGYIVQSSLTNAILVDFGNDTEKFLAKCREHKILVANNFNHASIEQYVKITIGTRVLMEKVLQTIFPL